MAIGQFFSQRFGYAVHALAFVAKKPAGELTTLPELIEETNVVPYYEVRPVPIEPVPNPVIEDTSMRGRAILSVRVPAAARIFENGREKIGAGSARRYVAAGLEPGKHYRYEVRAEILRDDQKISQTKVIVVQAGQKVNLVFNLDPDALLVSGAPHAAAGKK